MKPPVAKKRPHRLEKHEDVRVDNYYWMSDRNNPEVLAYLKAENDYLNDQFGRTDAIQVELFEEIKSRIKQTDVSVPYREGDYFYYWRYLDGLDYRIYCRKAVGSDEEQIILNVNKISQNHDYCDVLCLGLSTDEQILAYAVDTVGRRQYELNFRDLRTNTTLVDVVRDFTGNAVWANDNRTIFYGRQHPETLRSFQIWRHTLGEDVSCDELVYEENDNTFSCAVGKSRSKQYVLIGSYHTSTTEYRYLDAKTPKEALSVFRPRQRGHEYHIDHFRNRFYMRTNLNAKNFRLLELDGPRQEMNEGRELVSHRDAVLFEEYELFRDYFVVQERINGLVSLRIRPWSGNADHAIEFPDAAYDVFIDDCNKLADTDMFRFGYSSLSTPESTYDYDMRTRRRTLLKCDEVLGGFNKNNYCTKRIYATADDGTRVPISLVSRKNTPHDGTSPLLLYGYGSYGISMDASFSSARLSLLDRGFIFAIAHVRGGEELGRQWYNDGKLLKKKNTFTDFISCAEHLIAECYTASDKVFAMGGSAGGLLMGAILNMRPDLFHGVIAQVPFVDVVTTMLDKSIPLTTGEYDEWGDPEKEQYYGYIKSYSPYDNVLAKEYPNILVMTGIHDSQVQFWEPAKWVAKLRARKTDNNLLLFRTNMDAGHSGASGRYQRYRETALQYAFLLDLAGAPGRPKKKTPISKR